MKRMIALFALTTFFCLFCICSKAKEETQKPVEDLTGYTTVKNGEAMKKKIKEIEKLQEKRLKEAEDIK